MTQRSFHKMHTAICGTGYLRYIDVLYDRVNKESPDLVNMQIRYWIEAVEKFYNTKRPEYEEDFVEEGILIVNNLANSLLILGGVNWNKDGNDHVPGLLDLYSGNPFQLKKEEPQLYEKLDELNFLYNKLSKHFTRDRSELYSRLNYDKLKDLFDSTAKIWLYVCHSHLNTEEFDVLFYEPIEILELKGE